MTSAAGILFVAPGDQALFLKRGPGGDFPGHWCFPGGHAEPEDATIEATAEREAREELGFLPRGTRTELASTIISQNGGLSSGGEPPQAGDGLTPLPSSAAVFTTFLQRVDGTFDPRLDGEHVGFAWAPVGSPPQPIHPGCEAALLRTSMDELGVAQAIRDGRLASPQRYQNVWLFAIRITGTGAAYRSAKREYVWRDAEHYLNDEFLARCAGLAVIMEHPEKKPVLDSKEFGDRIIGSVFLPYIRGSEVWGIAKIYDAAAARMMDQQQLSTSPGVAWKDLATSTVFKNEDGSTLLVEGKPDLLDHVAVCPCGVWDKGGEPEGVLNDKLKLERTDSDMNEDEKKAAADKARKDADDERARKDAEAGEKLDKLLSMQDSIMSKVDSVCGRMDALEEKEKTRADAEEATRKDAAKKDGEDKDEKKDEKKDDKPAEAVDKSLKDAVKKDGEDKDEKKDDKPFESAKDGHRHDAATIDSIRAEMEVLRKSMPRAHTDDERLGFATAQARADSVYLGFNRQAPQPMNGEALGAYRVRLAREMQRYAPTWKDVNLAVSAADSASFDIIEAKVYEEANATSLNPPDLKDGELRMVERHDRQTGVRSLDFVGKHSFVRDHTLTPQYVTHIGVNKDAA